MPRTSIRPARGEEGAAAVELAIVLPMLLLLVFGLIDFGRMIQQQIQLTEAVREGARVGAVLGTVADQKAKVAKILGTSITPTYTTTAVCTASSAATADAQVTATIAFTPITPVFAAMSLFGGSSSPTSITLSATGVMNCIG